jgi:hypothetical protein
MAYSDNECTWVGFKLRLTPSVQSTALVSSTLFWAIIWVGAIARPPLAPAQAGTRVAGYKTYYDLVLQNTETQPIRAQGQLP